MALIDLQGLEPLLPSSERSSEVALLCSEVGGDAFRGRCCSEWLEVVDMGARNRKVLEQALKPRQP